jgi:hypothetical protein
MKSIIQLPQFLFRGDSDKKGVRNLRDTIEHYQLQTNLLNGGNGREIKEEPLLNLIDKHVALSYSLTHFLSFTENEMTAFRFGLHCEPNEVEEKMFEYSGYYEQNKNWSFATTTIDTHKIEWKEIDNGIYEGLHPTTLTKFQNHTAYRIICINVVTVLQGQEQYFKSITNAKRDSEWLILPATNVTLNNSVTEYSGIWDVGHIAEIKKYNKYDDA